MCALSCWRGIWKIYNEESLHRIFIFSKHSFSKICVIIRASVGMRFFFLFFTSQLRHITIRLCFSPLFSQPNKPQFSRAICNVKGSSDSLSLLSFVLGENVLRGLYEVLAFSLKLLQFFWTRWSWACATIWVSVEVKFFSPFFSWPDRFRSDCKNTIARLRFFSPLFPRPADGKSSRKTAASLPLLFFLFGYKDLHICL